MGDDIPFDMQQRIKEKFTAMMRALHQEEGASLRIEIMADPEIKDFINTHADVLDSSVGTVAMSDAMRQRLERSNWIFSGMKTFHELNEAFPSLTDEDGTRKPFERFLNDVQRIDETYNRNYLRSEYNFVHASADMAAKWEEFAADGDRYYLQYRTAQDDRVRPEHADLEGVTLPIDDSFWASYYPPNGWNCRCTVVQVRKAKYQPTDHNEAMARGEAALQLDKRGIFRFNSGIEQKTVPDYNPYTISQCRNCDIAKGSVKLAFVPQNELCQACQLLHNLRQQEKGQRLDNSDRRQARDAVAKWAEKHLPTVETFSGKAKRLLVKNEATGNDVIVNRKFFSETYAKNIRSRNVAETMQLATLVNEWLPGAAHVSTEQGRHHNCQFKVFRANYQGVNIECKAKVLPTGIFLYTMRIVQ